MAFLDQYHIHFALPRITACMENPFRSGILVFAELTCGPSTRLDTWASLLSIVTSAKRRWLCGAGVGQVYITKGYIPPALSGATTCVKQTVGNTPANCPVSAGVPLTDEGKPGSTVCITQYSTGKVRALPSIYQWKDWQQQRHTISIMGNSNSEGRMKITCKQTMNRTQVKWEVHMLNQSMTSKAMQDFF